MRQIRTTAFCTISLMAVAALFGGCKAKSPTTWFKRGETPPPPSSETAEAEQRGSKLNPKNWFRGGSRGGGETVEDHPAVYESNPNMYGAEAAAEFAKAKELVQNHRFQQAQGILENLIARNPNHAGAYRWLGDCYYNLMDLERAIQSYSKARELDPQDYYALRGKGFAHLHLGHEMWQRYEGALQKQDKAGAHEYLGSAHENYKRSLELLQQALRVFQGDNEAMYGRAMAAEGASRKLYANAVGLLKNGETEDAHAWAENCLEIIDEGIEAATQRIKDHPDRAGPRKLVGGLYFRRAMLLKSFGENRAAVDELSKAMATQQSILDQIDPNNSHAKQELGRCKAIFEQWRREVEAG